MIRQKRALAKRLVSRGTVFSEFIHLGWVFVVIRQGSVHLRQRTVELVSHRLGRKRVVEYHLGDL
jgi:hypothetical protein